MSDRDFVYVHWVNKEAHATNLVQCSISDQDAAQYEQSLKQQVKWKKNKFKRGKIVVQATILTPQPGNKCQVLWISCVDPGGDANPGAGARLRVAGSLPKAKKTTAEKGAESVAALQKAAYE